MSCPRLTGGCSWGLPDLPADCAPGRAPELFTDEQAHARIVYGLTRTDWTQRRIGQFAGRSATTVNTIKAAVLDNSKQKGEADGLPFAGGACANTRSA